MVGKCPKALGFVEMEVPKLNKMLLFGHVFTGVTRHEIGARRTISDLCFTAYSPIAICF
jgi:hypothetical protein